MLPANKHTVPQRDLQPIDLVMSKIMTHTRPSERRGTVFLRRFAGCVGPEVRGAGEEFGLPGGFLVEAELLRPVSSEVVEGCGGVGRGGAEGAEGVDACVVHVGFGVVEG